MDETLQLFAQRREMAEADAAVPVRRADGSWSAPDPEQVSSRSWFPVFQGGDSEIIFISNGEDHAGAVWLHPVQDEPRRQYDSLGDAAHAVRMALIVGRLMLDKTRVLIPRSTMSAGIEI
jgi:hypothetical protein